MDFTTITGVAASILTGTASLPQLIKVIKEKKIHGISFAMLAVLSAGLATWVAYGFLKQDWILIISNGFSLLVNITIALLGLKYKKS